MTGPNRVDAMAGRIAGETAAYSLEVAHLAYVTVGLVIDGASMVVVWSVQLAQLLESIGRIGRRRSQRLTQGDQAGQDDVEVPSEGADDVL